MAASTVRTARTAGITRAIDLIIGEEGTYCGSFAHAAGPNGPLSPVQLGRTALWSRTWPLLTVALIVEAGNQVGPVRGPPHRIARGQRPP